MTARKQDYATGKTCRKCKKELVPNRVGSRSQLEGPSIFNRRVYCDRACMAAWMEGQIKILNPRNSRKQSTKKKSDSCSTCGGKRRLAVHHKDENPLNNDLTNLVTVCQSCHMKGHWIGWRKTIWPFRKCLHCSERVKSNWMCQKHFQRWKKYGDPFLSKSRVYGHPNAYQIVRVDD